MTAKAPFKRGQKLHYSGPDHPHGQCKYVRWWGFQRAALIVVRFPCGRELTAHVNDVKVIP